MRHSGHSRRISGDMSHIDESESYDKRFEREMVKLKPSNTPFIDPLEQPGSEDSLGGTGKMLFASVSTSSARPSTSTTSLGASKSKKGTSSLFPALPKSKNSNVPLLARELAHSSSIAKRLKTSDLLTKETRTMVDGATNQRSHNTMDQGLRLYQQGDYPAAIEKLSHVLSMDKKNFFAYLHRGLAFDRLGRYQRAIADFSTCVKLNPGKSTPYYNRGLCQMQLNEFALAIVDFDKAGSLDPQSADVLYSRALAFRRQLNFLEAQKDYTTLRAVNLKNAPAVAARAAEEQRLQRKLTRPLRNALKCAPLKRSYNQVELLAMHSMEHVYCLRHYPEPVLQDAWGSMTWQEAREDAVAWLETDPTLGRPESASVRAVLDARWAGRLELARVG